jgi:hypothetical protein
MIRPRIVSATGLPILIFAVATAACNGNGNSSERCDDAASRTEYRSRLMTSYQGNQDETVCVFMSAAAEESASCEDGTSVHLRVKQTITVHRSGELDIQPPELAVPVEEACS